MANHLRQQIRERVATDVTSLTTTSTRVYQSRVYPMQESANLPGLIVYTTEESSELDTLSITRNQLRTLNVVIEGYAQATSDVDDTLDTIAKEVEVALAADRTINSLAKDSYLSSTSIELNGEGRQPIGVVTMNYTVIYRTAEGTPDAAA